MFVYDFIEKIGKIEVKYSRKFRKRYLTFTEEFSSEQEYNQQLDEYLIEFRKEIQSLPFSLNSKQSRKVFLHNIYDEFLYTRERLNEQFIQLVSQSHDCITLQKVRFKCCFPKYFQKKYLKKARTAYRQLHVVFTLRIDKIETAVDILKLTALNDGIEMDISDKQSPVRFKTNLSSPELAYLSFRIMNKVSVDPNFNRTHLSRILADNFSTKRAEFPKAEQIRKQFTDVNDNVKNKVESLLEELANANTV
ncbi:hypothetical protein [Plebeiibacterium sediminum]|uniref:Uncharacterized protein n=1 Tax=Plebeiibacterium sediminum TaxID=2992112 RepID=A0AAE3SGH5_9BACT|nr:hypothetical protein [Plebeiobacterium sediminum]MCW3788505.1 hypothetical protein [Plebeiobacterium sediminum]